MPVHGWTTSQIAAVAAAEAIAAAAAVDVAHEAAATAQLAVDVASAAATRAAVKAAEVAAEAVLAAAAAAVEDLGEDASGDGAPRTTSVGVSESASLSPGSAGQGDFPESAVGEQARRALLEATVATAAAATAAATVAVSVAAVAEAAARAVVRAAGLIGDQLARDVAATAQAVAVATVVAGTNAGGTSEVSGTRLLLTADAPEDGAGQVAPSRSWVAPVSMTSAEVSRIASLHSQGASLHTIAASLNSDGSRTVRGRRWSAQSVTQVLARASARNNVRPGVATGTGSPVASSGGLDRARQQSSRLAADRRLAESQWHLAEAQRLGGTGSWSWTVASDQVSWSEEMYRLFGVDPATFEATYAGLLECVHPEDRAMVADAVGSVFTGSTAYEFDHRVLHSNGDVVWLHARGDAVRDEQGAPVRLYGTVVDRTAAELAEQRDRQHALDLVRLASHDALTGLANRGLLRERLGHALARRGPGLSVLVLNVDDFKAVNDVAGHAGGDRLLVELASRLSSHAQGAHNVARLSGDTFAVIVEQGEPREVAQRVLTALAMPVTIGSLQTMPSASVGIATSDDTTGADELLVQADVAMYAAKAAGKGRIATFDAAMSDALHRRTDLHEALHGAVSRGEIVVHYQPIIDVALQCMSRLEALVRWQRPDGLVPPAEFLPLAEDTGLILGIGHDVLRQACEQMGEWLAEDGSRSISVNVSALQLAAADYADRALATLDAAGVQPDQVVLEVTETLFLDTTAGLLERLTVLRDRGIRVAIDDFGTGYSSLGRLHHLPIDSIKIDKSFVDLIQVSDDAEPILTSIIAMAHALGLDVTSEGVETWQQATLLIGLGCDYLQGFYFARPQPAPDALTAGTDRALSAWRAVGSAPSV